MKKMKKKYRNEMAIGNLGVRRMVMPFGTFVTLSLIILASSCATKPFGKVDSALLAGNYKQAETDIETDKQKLYAGNDAILYYLDKGMTAHYAGDYTTSNDLLQKGDRAIEDAYTKSVTQSIGSFIVNDNTVAYAGEDYENLYLNIFNALNYYHEGNLSDAMVEIRRMEEKLQQLKVKYNVYDEKLAGNKDADVKQYTDVKMNFSNSALARYLGMLFYRARGNWDDVRIDLESLKSAFATEKEVYNFPVPKSVDEDYNIPSGKARLNILSFSGLSPVKQEDVTRIPLPIAGAINWIKIALPSMKNRLSAVARIEIVFTGTANNGEKKQLELLENMQNVAGETFKKHLGVITAKSIIRATIKGASAAAANVVAHKTKDSSVALAATLGGLLLQGYAELSEHADLRMSRYFPAKAYITGLSLTPGVYSFSIRYYNGQGGLIRSFENENYTVDSNKLNLIETFCPN